jgi:hypothetical protein
MVFNTCHHKMKLDIRPLGVWRTAHKCTRFGIRRGHDARAIFAPLVNAFEELPSSNWCNTHHIVTQGVVSQSDVQMVLQISTHTW